MTTKAENLLSQGVSSDVVYTTIYSEKTESSAWPDLIANLKKGHISRLYLHYSDNDSPTFDLVGALTSSNCLENVIFKGCGFEQPLSKMVGALRAHKDLKKLTIRNYAEAVGQIDNELVSELATLIKSSLLESLEFIYIDFRTIEPSTFALFCDALENSTTLKYLDLSSVNASPENASRLRQTLAKNKNIKLSGDIRWTSTETGKGSVAVQSASEQVVAREITAEEQNFNRHLQLLEAKVKDFQMRAKEYPSNSIRGKKLDAADLAASNLHAKLKQTSEAYFKNPTAETYKAFRGVFDNDMADARLVLEEHRGWKQLLGNLALAILGAGVLYLIAGGINKAVTGQFLFFRTDSAKIVDGVEASAKSITFSAG